MSKKQIIILLVLLVVVAGAVFLYRTSYERWPWQKESAISLPTPTASANISQMPEEKTERGIIMEDVAQMIDEISSTKAAAGGQWKINRFWFVRGSDRDFYVEYSDGRVLRRLLLQMQETEMGLFYDAIAYFEAGESDWILKTGSDAQYGKSLDLYEFNQNLGRWVKKN